jgi:ABC-type multidrug transport system fused ATPase/permease subunit
MRTRNRKKGLVSYIDRHRFGMLSRTVSPTREAIAFALRYGSREDWHRLCAIGGAVCALSIMGALAPVALANLVGIAGNLHGEMLWASLYGITVVAPTSLGFAVQKTLLETVSRLVEHIRIGCISVAIRARASRAGLMPSGQIFSIVEADVDRFDAVISSFIVQAPQHLAIIGSILVAVWIHQPAFGPWIVLFALVLLVVAVVPKSKSIVLTALARNARERSSSQLDLLLSHVRLLKTVRRAERSIDAVLFTVDAARRTTFSANILSQAIASMPQVALAVATVCYLGVVISFDHGAVALPIVLAVTIYLEQALSPISNLASTSARLHASMPSVHRVVECFGHGVYEPEDVECGALHGTPRLALSLLSGAYCETTLDSHKVWMAPNGAGKTTALKAATGSSDSQGARVLLQNRQLSAGELERTTLYFDSQALGIWHRLVPGESNIDCMLSVLRECVARDERPLFVCFDETLDRIAKSSREVIEFIDGLNAIGLVAVIVTHKEEFRDCLVSMGSEEIRCIC